MKYIIFLGTFLLNSLSFTASIVVGESHSLFLDDNGHVWATGNNEKYQLGLGSYSKNIGSN